MVVHVVHNDSITFQKCKMSFGAMYNINEKSFTKWQQLKQLIQQYYVLNIKWTRSDFIKYFCNF